MNIFWFQTGIRYLCQIIEIGINVFGKFLRNDEFFLERELKYSTKGGV